MLPTTPATIARLRWLSAPAPAPVTAPPNAAVVMPRSPVWNPHPAWTRPAGMARKREMQRRARAGEPGGDMAEQKVGIIINGATGGMGTTQHVRHLVDIAREGGLPLRDGDRLVPDVLVVGRHAERLQVLAAANGRLRWSTDLDAALAGSDAIFMDCAATGGRPQLVC